MLQTLGFLQTNHLVKVYNHMFGLSFYKKGVYK